MASLDEYSVTSLRLALLCQNAEIGQASGFFYNNGCGYFLISNWHVFSGRNAYTGQSLRKDAALPDAIRLALHRKGMVGAMDEGTIRLRDDHETPTWLQHPLGQDVDVAALPIGDAPPHVAIYELPRPQEASDMVLRVGMDAYILGFPYGISLQKYLPIWKRASIATEPDLPHNDKPLFLVDTASREGMSGAPVVTRSFGGYDAFGDNRHIGPGAFTRFVGVYSGRYGADDELSAQLGRVWHRSVIDEIITAGTRGSYELRNHCSPIR